MGGCRGRTQRGGVPNTQPCPRAAPQDLNCQEEEDPMNKLKGQKIVSCRICKGDHWTTRCPYKDTLGPMQKELAEQLGLSTGEKEKLPGGSTPQNLRGKGGSLPVCGQPDPPACPFPARRAGAGAGADEQDGEIRPTEPARRRQPPRGVHAAQPQGYGGFWGAGVAPPGPK